MKKILICISLFGILFCRPVFALNTHNYSAALKTALVFLYIPSLMIPVNVWQGVTKQGSWLTGLAGMGGGAFQTTMGTLILSVSDEGDNMWVPGTLIGLGAANIGAGIFSIVNRPSSSVAMVPGVADKDGFHPGLSLEGKF